MSPAKNTKQNRQVGSLIAYTTLAASLVTLGVYFYRQSRKDDTADGRNTNNAESTRREGSRDGNFNGQQQTEQDGGRNLEPSLSTTAEVAPSSLSRLGSKIARTVNRRFRPVMTISVRDTIVWNPSPDPTIPNYGFVEGAVPLLFHLAEQYNLHLILLCASRPASTKGKETSTGFQDQENQKILQRQGFEHERNQILTMLRNASLISTAPETTSGGNGSQKKSNHASSWIDPRQFLICETEEGISHMVRHLESQVHIESRQAVVEMVQGQIPKVVYVQRKTGANSRRQSQEIEKSIGMAVHNDDEGVIADSVASLSNSFVQVSKEESLSASSSQSQKQLTSGYVTMAGKKGYLEVVDKLLSSSLIPGNK